MTSIRKIEEFCKSIAPYELADDWDNVGLLVGAENDSADKVLLALDITPEVVEEAQQIGAGLVCCAPSPPTARCMRSRKTASPHCVCTPISTVRKRA